jgi:hypothetical protein
MARYLLRHALAAIPGSGNAPLLRELDDLENAISPLDHRRYDAETRLARARANGSADTGAARRAIDDLVGEHRSYAGRALALRDAVLQRLDGALTAAG